GWKESRWRRMALPFWGQHVHDLASCWLDACPKRFVCFPQRLLAGKADVGELPIAEIAQSAALPPQLQHMAEPTPKRGRPFQPNPKRTRSRNGGQHWMGAISARHFSSL